MSEKKTVAILCSGGPAPGINSVISSIAKSFLRDNWRVVGINEGTKTMFTENPELIEFDFHYADYIYNRGGSILRMSRYKPKDSEFNTKFFTKNNVKLLVTIGGDDTASTANRITKFLNEKKVDVKNIHVPKTIDNDLPLPDRLPTFGYETAKNEGSRLAQTVYEDARSSGNWFVVSVMGREAGHLAFGIGTACHYPLVIIPEMFRAKKITFKKIINMVISSILKRKTYGVQHGVAIISEGVFHFIDEAEIVNCGINFTFDEHGHPELGTVSKAHIFNVLLQKELKELGIAVKSRPVELGYEIRSCHPTAFDLNYCTMLGMGVKKLYDEDHSGCIVIAKANGKISPLYLKDIEDPKTGKIKTRLVDVDAEDYKLAFSNMHYLKKDDYKKVSEFVEHPEDYDLEKILAAD
ncbi:6-phosphofructokinase [Patescibacteria group bacterium]|nr:6-phosphofructokinase [Patescibacteria group bacterium]MBU1682477.1 6-phosphofructokinase [Patescibacteria group bacterium]MBU1935489.1 6-phosphofructokinase [Patescibacteria group bacterium]